MNKVIQITCKNCSRCSLGFLQFAEHFRNCRSIDVSVKGGSLGASACLGGESVLVPRGDGRIGFRSGGVGMRRGRKWAHISGWSWGIRSVFRDMHFCGVEPRGKAELRPGVLLGAAAWPARLPRFRAGFAPFARRQKCTSCKIERIPPDHPGLRPWVMPKSGLNLLILAALHLSSPCSCASRIVAASVLVSTTARVASVSAFETARGTAARGAGAGAGAAPGNSPFHVRFVGFCD